MSRRLSKPHNKSCLSLSEMGPTTTHYKKGFPLLLLTQIPATFQPWLEPFFSPLSPLELFLPQRKPKIWSAKTLPHLPSFPSMWFSRDLAKDRTLFQAFLLLWSFKRLAMVIFISNPCFPLYLRHFDTTCIRFSWALHIHWFSRVFHGNNWGFYDFGAWSFIEISIRVFYISTCQRQVHLPCSFH